jgi:pimeloyl-ACP methyl ester carboxylesterase
MADTKAPVVFIHGLWLHASSWAPWQGLFAAAGYETFAPGWPGDADTVEGCRADPDSIANRGIDDVTSHYTAFIDTLPAMPILIGHSFGGMIAEKLLGMDYGAGAIGIDAAQIKGVLPLPLSSLRATLPVFRNPANKHKAVSLTAAEFHYSFGNALAEQESNDLYERNSSRLSAAAPSPAVGSRTGAIALTGTASIAITPAAWVSAASVSASSPPSPWPISTGRVVKRFAICA